MQLALIGLPQSGVKTTFAAITGLTEAAGAYSSGGASGRISVLKVPDDRLETITAVYKPKKSTPATVEIAEFPGLFGQKVESRTLAKAREADALALVLRAFPSSVLPHPAGSVDPERDLQTLEAEMLLADLAIVETRLERLDASLQKRKNEEEEAEREVLQRCKTALDESQPLRQLGLLPQDTKKIRGFGFLTLKPLMLLLNIGDSQLGQEEKLLESFVQAGLPARALCADVEAELSQMEPEERDEFMEDFGITELAAPAVLSAAYQTLAIVTFYTYGEDECRAWTVREGETAVDAAGKIHSDLARGFIRAEVVAYDDFVAAGDIKGAKAAGKFRLEGKEYPVHDGDLIIIRHNA